MVNILHRVGIAATPDRVFEALATLAGVQAWWISTATGDAAQGGVIDFGFCDMQVKHADANSLVHWRCTRGPDEWVGTDVIFRLEWKDNQTFVLFQHANWREAIEFTHHCSTKWATFLLSLRDHLEHGAGRPHPRALRIYVGEAM